MTFQEPTYEEYKSASGFAKFRYKYGLLVTIACWISFLFLIYFIVNYGEELATDPMAYAMRQKPKLECHCYEPGEYTQYERRIDFYINSTNKWLEFSDVQDVANLPTQQELEDIFKKFEQK